MVAHKYWRTLEGVAVPCQESASSDIGTEKQPSNQIRFTFDFITNVKSTTNKPLECIAGAQDIADGDSWIISSMESVMSFTLVVIALPCVLAYAARR